MEEQQKPRRRIDVEEDLAEAWDNEQAALLARATRRIRPGRDRSDEAANERPDSRRTKG